jgi:putative membrane protein
MRPHHFGPGLFGPLLAIGFLVLLTLAVAALAWWLIRRRKGRAGFEPHPRWHGGPPVPHPGAGPVPVPPPVSALQILDERLARGDLDVDDYLTRRAALLGDRPPNGTEFEHGQPSPPETPHSDPAG